MIIEPCLKPGRGIDHQHYTVQSHTNYSLNETSHFAFLEIQFLETHSNSLSQLINLGEYHYSRFEHLGQPDDIEKAVEYMSIALSLTPDGDSSLPYRLSSLGRAHGLRFQRLGELGDLDKSIEYSTRAITSTPNDHPDLPSLLQNLGASYLIQFQRTGDLDHINKATEYMSLSLALIPDNDPNLPTLVSNLGVCYNNRFERLDDLGDLEKSIEYKSRALSLTPHGHPHVPSMLRSLGSSYGVRFQRLGELEDSEKAAKYMSIALTLTPDNHPEFVPLLSNLGTFYEHRFKRLGKLGDLDKSIEFNSRAVNLTPSGHPYLPLRCMNLGGSYRQRFERLGELEDLQKSIECTSRAVSLTPDGHPDLPDRLMNLGASLTSRFEVLNELADLEKGIEFKSLSLSLTPEGHPHLPYRLMGVSASYGARFRCLGKLVDVDKAIECGSQALSLTPDDHPELPSRLMNLALSLTDRFEHLPKPGDIENATAYALCALSLTPSGHPALAKQYHTLARSQFFYSQSTGDISLLQDSTISFSKASQSLVGPPRSKFKAALDWANLASIHNSLNPIEAYQTAIDLLPQVVWLGATTTQRYQDLAPAKTLALDAACTAIRFSNYGLALEWLESARCVVWNQRLMLRSPLGDLQSSHPALASRLQTVATELNYAGSQSSASRELSLNGMSPEEAAQGHRRLAQEYVDLLSRARELPGFQDFLRPMKANSLTRAARSGPIVVVNCHKDRCDALLILPDQNNINHVPLPNFTLKKAHSVRSKLETSVRSKSIPGRGKRRPVLEPEDDFVDMLATLWYDLVRPVLDHLGYIDNVSHVSMPHITWCPTGPLSFLPLHAAGDYLQPGCRVFDYVISSYTPTLTALLTSTASTLGPGSRVLAIGQEATPGQSQLPGTAQELAYLQAHVPSMVPYTQLVNERATTAAVLDAMEQHDWVHLACHAQQDVADATQSGFFLHDGTLDLAAINRRSFKSKGLAYLSACQTAKGDKNLPDEAVHLSSGMLMAGYSSVIGTMWSVHDDDAPLVADKVYAQLMEGGKLGNGEAGKALHNAVAELRERVGEKEFGRWVPYIHIGS
ncbi:hypothetical protein OPQ81_003400 [Rhizoctonia solani]|nr:hypothetical protein OPQ81_003400 [Rhizoctonia solani]